VHETKVLNFFKFTVVLSFERIDAAGDAKADDTEVVPPSRSYEGNVLEHAEDTDRDRVRARATYDRTDELRAREPTVRSIGRNEARCSPQVFPAV
jgi:hypothetical protein